MWPCASDLNELHDTDILNVSFKIFELLRSRHNGNVASLEIELHINWYPVMKSSLVP